MNLLLPSNFLRLGPHTIPAGVSVLAGHIRNNHTLPPSLRHSAVVMTWQPGGSQAGQASTSSRLCWLRIASYSPAVLNVTERQYSGSVYECMQCAGRLLQLDIPPIIARETALDAARQPLRSSIDTLCTKSALKL